nr:immunoglobulin light chain junction region [Macaca mulatta]MOV37513.1 immunoglobulin light chain junction region [Macaca mulatta]
CQQGYSYPISF